MTDTCLSVLVTRPAAQAESWLRAFQARGWQTLSFPTLDIQPLELSPQAKNRVLNLDQYQGVICISGNAANLGLELLADYWPQWPVQQLWYAVGPATAEVLLEWQLQPEMPRRHDSEGLLGLASLQQVQGRRLLILKGEGGRTTLRDTLLERGALVDELCLYRRTLPEVSTEPLHHWLADTRSRKYIAISSGAGLKNLMQMAAEHLDRLKSVPLVVVSQRLAEFAQSQGFSAINAGGTSEDLLVQAMIKGSSTS